MYFSCIFTDPVRRITIEHVPLRSQETFTSTSIYKTDFKRISATGNRNPEYRENTPCPPSGRFSVAKCTDLEPKSDQHSDESHTPRMSTKSSYKIDYQPYAVPSVRVPLLTRRVAPQLFSRPVSVEDSFLRINLIQLCGCRFGKILFKNVCISSNNIPV